MIPVKHLTLGNLTKLLLDAVRENKTFTLLSKIRKDMPKYAMYFYRMFHDTRC